jgi:5-methylcytosine-specific restriction endonuclease McrA
MGSIHNNYHAWRKLRLKVLQRDDYTCYVCGGTANAVDHLVPRAMGLDELDHDENNLAAICKSCNSVKGAKLGFLSEAPTPKPPSVYSLPNTIKLNPNGPFQAI